MKNRFFYFVILLLAVCLSANANDFKKKRKKQETTPALADALKKEKTEDKSYDKVITKEARTKKGLITLHMVKSTFYMEIPVKWKLRTVQKQKNLISRQIRRHRMRTEGKRNNHEEMVQISCSRSVGITDTLCGRMRGSES